MHPSALSLSHSPSINTEYIWMDGAIKSLGHTCKWICVWCVTFMCKWAHCFSSHYFVRFVSADDPIRPNKCNLSNFHHIYLSSIHFNEFHSSGWENVKGMSAKEENAKRECLGEFFFMRQDSNDLVSSLSHSQWLIVMSSKIILIALLIGYSVHSNGSG